MTTNEIKKELYKQNPKAKFDFIRQGLAYYKAKITVENEGQIPFNKFITFEVPISDMGSADFFAEIDAKHLNRWIVNEEK
jgi:hypothetical protein